MTHTRRIERYRLNRSAVSSVPRAELELFLAMGHLHNELAFFQRLLVWILPTATKGEEPHLQAGLTESMILMRLLGARIFEAWNTLEKSLFNHRFSLEYQEQLREPAQLALEAIKGQPKRRLKTLRDQFVYHSTGSAIGSGLDHLASEELDFYLGQYASESLFYASEVVLNIALLESADGEERRDRLDSLVREIVKYAGEWILLSQGLIDVFLRRHPQIKEEEATELVLGNLVDFDRVQIPWFTDVSTMELVNESSSNRSQLE